MDRPGGTNIVQADSMANPITNGAERRSESEEEEQDR
jgi:hypothetical protein